MFFSVQLNNKQTKDKMNIFIRLNYKNRNINLQ